MIAVAIRRGISFAVFLAAVQMLASCSPPAEAAVVKGSLFSPANGRTIDYRVYTPPGYSATSATRYPVVFSLHGNNGTPSQRAANYAPTLDQKMRSGEIMPMIWVFPDGQTNSYYGDAFDGHKQVYSNIIEELVPDIDAKFKTFRHRAGRALEGFSMGGFGAGLYAATDPQLFSATLLQGGVLPKWSELLRKEADVAEEMYNNIEANWRPYSVYDATGANAAAIDAMVNYKMIVGDIDGHMRGNLRFRDYLISLGIDPQFQIIPGVSHAGSMYLREGSGLRFLDQHFRAQQARVAVAAVPEPSAWGLMVAAAVPGILAARRRPRAA